MEDLINEDYIRRIRDYLKIRTGKLYFKYIRYMNDNIQVTCPFHKDGQENKPSATIRVTNSEKASAGLFSCFTCHEAMMLDDMIAKILGPLYDANDVEKNLQISSIIFKSSFIKPKKEYLFNIDKPDYISSSVINQFKYYHPYLESRHINKDIADLYDLGFDKVNNQIIFPIYNIKHKCVGLGRRGILQKVYRYPNGMQKPLYGLYELDQFLNYVYIVEGPFNLWSLRQWGKQGVALLGTGTEYQYNQLLDIKCKGFVCALDPDEAGIKGTNRIIHFLLNKHIKNIYVTILPIGKDVNDLNEQEFKQLPVLTYREWLSFNGSNLNKV